MAYLVTGGTGLIGSRIVRDLSREGEQVVVYDLYPREDFLRRLLSEKEMSRVKIERGDVTDLPGLLHSIKDNNVERIIHMASLVLYTSAANPHLAVRVNCEGTANIFEIARLLGLKKVVWASSVAVFGTSDKYPQEFVPNDAPYYPGSVYGASKCFNEVMAAHYVKAYGVDISGIRYTLTYGIGQRWGTLGHIMRELVENPVAGKPGKVPYGDDVFGWLYVNDAARATVMMSRAPMPRTKAFTISGELRSVKDAVDYIKSLLPGADLTIEPGSVGMGFKYETTPIEEEIGYRAEWSMEEGLRDSLNFARQQHGLSPV